MVDGNLSDTFDVTTGVLHAGRCSGYFSICCDGWLLAEKATTQLDSAVVTHPRRSWAKRRLFGKSGGILPGTVDRMSNYVTTLGPEWGKGDCGPFEFPAVIVNATSSGASVEELKNTRSEINVCNKFTVKTLPCYRCYNTEIGSLKSPHTFLTNILHAGKIWTKKPGFWNHFLPKRWRHFGRRFCSWNNCLMLFQKLR